MRVLGVLQARFSSSRLPGKVMLPILGRPMLARQLERLRRAGSLDGLMIATSLSATDDPVARLAEEESLPVFRGSLEDVLDRFYSASLPYAPEHCVRLTGDCPLTDPQLVDTLVAAHLGGDHDYTSNALEPTFPDGMDVEVVRFACLEEAWREATLLSQREHVMPFITGQPGRYRLCSYKGGRDLSALRWTVDEPDDFELIRAIYEELYPADPAFSTSDVLALLERRPELKTLNLSHRRNEGYLVSLARDPKEP